MVLEYRAMESDYYDIIVIGGGHAGSEAAWAAAASGAEVALITMDASKIGAMSCNPAIGGLAKGQIVREIDALGGIMGRAIDGTGIQFRILNTSRGAAVHGPRAQADKYRYAREVQRILKLRPITILEGCVDRILVNGAGDRCLGVIACEKVYEAGAVVLTTGTFMRGLMHTGERKTVGGRVDEGSAEGMSGALRELGFELGRLKTGTPPRLAAESIEWEHLEEQWGDDKPASFSEMSPDLLTGERFPVLKQVCCHTTYTNETIHGLIRDNLDRAPMYTGEIDAECGPRYCPSIEDKVVRFAERGSHHVFLEPEGLDTNEIYCNGISTSLPADIQDEMIANLPGCENAKILRYGYAVEYDLVWPHQIDATTMTKSIAGLFLAGQINGTSGYEEAGAQGVVAGLNASRYVGGKELVRLGRETSYIGVMLDDLVTKQPREPYRMFTSRAEFRLSLRADNAPDRLTPLADEWGLIDDARRRKFDARRDIREKILDRVRITRNNGAMLSDRPKRGDVSFDEWYGQLPGNCDRGPAFTVFNDLRYEAYIRRQAVDNRKIAEMENRPVPSDLSFGSIKGLRNEAVEVLTKFRPSTLGQAGRLAGVNPADLTLLAITLDSVNSMKKG